MVNIKVQEYFVIVPQSSKTILVCVYITVHYSKPLCFIPRAVLRLYSSELIKRTNWNHIYEPNMEECVSDTNPWTMSKMFWMNDE